MSVIIDTYDSIYLDFLTETSVSVLKQTYAKINGENVQIGQNQRTAYSNSPSGRKRVIKDLDEKYVNAIFAIWGDKPILNDWFQQTD